MYIIIVGGGEIGYYLCRALAEEGNEILVIDKDPKRCERLLDELGSVCIRGDGCEANTLSEAGAARADILIAVTHEDEDNLVSCQVAKHHFNVRRTIALVNNPKNQKIFHKLGIDCTVSVTKLLLEHIAEEIPSHPLVRLWELTRENLEIVEVKIQEKSKAKGKKMLDIALPQGALPSLLIRNGQKPQVITMETTIQVGDRIIALTPPDQEEALRLALAGN